MTCVSYAKKVRDYQLDLTINSATLYAGDDFSRNASHGNGKYYVKAKVTGDGAYNASGETSVLGQIIPKLVLSCIIISI